MSLALDGIIRTRLVANLRADPERVLPLLPAGAEPALVEGAAVVGICFVRQERLRPAGLPAIGGVSFVAAAHRIAITLGGERAVVVLRRDAPGRILRLASRLAGTRFGAAHLSTPSPGSATLDADDGVFASVLPCAGAGSSVLFAGAEEAAAFFRAESLSVEPDGHALRAVFPPGWTLEAVPGVRVRSSYFEALGAVPDAAFLARDLRARWQPEKQNPNGSVAASPRASWTRNSRENACRNVILDVTSIRAILLMNP